ncbi:hypothetical protein ACOMHN_043993 [Nucella lapillus]
MICLLKRALLNKCRNKGHYVKISCCVLLCALIPFNIMFYTRGCRHTKIFFNPDNPESFRHSHPPQLPSHLFSQPVYGKAAVEHAVEMLAAPVTPVAHFIWCSNDYFQYQNYLSILSIFKFLKPTAIHFHYGDLPELDSDGYYQFFMDLRKDLPNLVLESVSAWKACSSNIDTKFDFVLNLLNDRGGIYVGESIVLAESLSQYRKKSFSVAASGSSLDIVMMQKGFLDNQASRPKLSEVVKKSKFSCAAETSYQKSLNMPCVCVNKQIFPVSVWEQKSDFGQLARWLTYGKMEILKPNPANSTVIPNIVHYVWLGDNKLKYFSYLSLLSALYVLNADMVYIHGDIEPRGQYWHKIKGHKRVTFVSRDVPGAIFSEPIVKFLSHASDYWRGDLLIRYGGIYMDWDVIWVRPIPEELRRYETVACPDFPATGAFPDVFNMGVVMAGRGSRYLRYFLESYHHYLDTHWSYNAIHMSYKVYEKHPDLLHVNRHLQVICAKGLCHPVWNANFKDASVHHLSSSPFDWHSDTLALHWTYPDPDEFADEQSLSESITTFASIAKYVLRKAEHRLEKELV